MSRKYFEGSMAHTDKSVRRMFCLQFGQYHLKQELAIILVGVLLIALALLLSVTEGIRLLLLFLGSWMVVSKDLPAVLKASEVVKQRQGMLPKYRYRFFEKEIQMEGEGKMMLPYEKCIRLVEDRGYYYIFTDPNALIMLDKESLQPKKEEEFRDFLTKKTQLRIRKANTLLTLTLRDLFPEKGRR